MKLYLKTNIGSYALTMPIDKKYPEPRQFLVKMTEEAIKRHEHELTEAKVSCVETKTGAKFCIFSFDGKEIEAMQMAHPICKLAKIAKGIPEDEASRKCIEEGKDAFLVISKEG